MSFFARPKSDIPDTVTQFLNQKRFLAKKSTQASPDGFQASLEFDDARVYFPGQNISAKVHLPAIDPAEIEGIDVELKGWTHSYGWQSNGQSSYPVYERDTHWSLQSTISGPADGQAQTLSIRKLDDGSNTWLVNAQLPISVAVKTGWRSHGNTFDIPPTFKDVKRGSMFNSVYWALKLTVKRTANLKRNYRFWRPFLVLPLANPNQAPVPNLPMLAPISEQGTAIPPTPHYIHSQLLDPKTWNVFEFENKIKTALILSKGTITTHLFVPNTGRVGPVPILLHVAVSAKKAEDLMSSSVRLPDLPLSASADQGAEPPYPGKGKGKQSADSSSHEDFYPSFEIIRRVRSHAQGGRDRSRHRIPVIAEWDTPAFLSSATDLSKASLDHGYAWTDPMPTAQAGLGISGNVNESSSLPYTRSALMTGRIFINVPPPIDMNNLRVHYRLHFRWNQPGLGNSITSKLGRWVSTSGVSAAELKASLGERLPDDQMSPEQVQAWKDIDRRVLGPSYSLLTDPSQNADDDEDDGDAKNIKFDDDDDDEGDSKDSKWAVFGRSKKNKGDEEDPEEGHSHGWRLFSKKTDQSKSKGGDDDDDDSSDEDDNALPEYDGAGRPEGPRDVKQ
ncbi:hypothetical protein OC845_006516 [Tilletia horrida]|nr:hypothetical protein OC845_006516 [Tilletia horrida]